MDTDKNCVLLSDCAIKKRNSQKSVSTVTIPKIKTEKQGGFYFNSSGAERDLLIAYLFNIINSSMLEDGWIIPKDWVDDVHQVCVVNDVDGKPMAWRYFSPFRGFEKPASVKRILAGAFRKSPKVELWTGTQCDKHSNIYFRTNEEKRSERI